ncbi:MAG: nitronate monooxygenase [Chromatiales bacterium]|nr:MAG: nitronate monooxygenase [Chromatiales bacterium]
MTGTSIPTRLTDRYGLTHPIACAGMAFVTLSPRLPVAVCEAGALGAFAAGPFPPDFIRANVTAIAEQTNGPVNLNFITPFITDAHIELAAELQPAVVQFHWALPPKDWVDRLHAAGVDVWHQVGSATDAQRAVDLGVEGIIAQGLEAGGHCYGKLPLFALLPAVLDAVGDTALVLAAGGIADGRSMAGALALGADGVVVGTRLMATPEADVADEYKQRIVAAGAQDTVLSSMFGRDMPDFNPMRLIRNALVEEWHDKVDDIDAMGDREQPVIGTMELGSQVMEMRRFSSLLPVQGATGDFDQMPLTAGQGLGVIHDIRPAGQVIEDMAAEAARALARIRAG